MGTITYQVKLRLFSSFLSPFQADIIFGHLCWALYYLEGEESLSDLLFLFKSGQPPFIISDGFPIIYDREEQVLLLPKPFSAEFLKPADKKIKKSIWLSFDDFNLVRKGLPPKYEREILFPKLQLSVHNRINRLTLTTPEEVGVFSLKEYFSPEIVIFVKIFSDEWKNKLLELLNFIAQSGYGSKKSIGKGHFKIIDFSPFSFEEIYSPNSFVSLSNFCPSPDDPTEGVYKTFVKYGKLGEFYTYSGNPFKRPLLMIKSGSVLKTPGPPKEFYGRMVEGISDLLPQVVQYAYAFSISAIFPDIEGGDQ